jgi:predicted nucleic-acid-binding protein
VVERAESAWKALRAWDASAADFSDALIGQTVMVQGGSGTVTFDRTAARLPGFQLLQ